MSWWKIFSSLSLINFAILKFCLASNDLFSVSSLSEYCQQKAVTPFYAKAYQERQIEKMFITTFQKLITQELKKNFYSLALKVSTNEWDQLVDQLKYDVKNECRSSGLLFSPTYFLGGLLSSFHQKNNLHLFEHNELLKNINEEQRIKLHQTNLSLARQVFRDTCSWSGLVSESEVMNSYLSDPAIGLKTLKKLQWDPRPILCSDEGCKEVSRSTWVATLPRPQERRSIQEDLQDYWCGNFFTKRVATTPGFRWKVTFAGDLLLNHHDPFYLHLLGIPLVQQWEKKLQSSLNPWAKEELLRSVQRQSWEEPLQVKLLSRDENFLDKKGLHVEIYYGEFDRNFETFDKIFYQSKLVLNRQLLDWSMRLKYKKRVEVERTVSINIQAQLTQLSETYHFLKYAPKLSQDLAVWVMDNLEQILTHRGELNQNPIIEIPMEFRAGIMALKLIHDRKL
ncbi:MAG: hypothetical protein QE271_00140 [Bacteriovoracaceae bacterium]|nr:hypothetical protein [Bacteriovoracaceae bacterium]